MNIKEQIGLRIKELRKKRHLTQEKLSELLDISQNTLSCIETGDNFFTSETLEKIIKTFDIEPEELFSFGYQKSQKELIDEINKMLIENPDKISDIYKITRSLVK